MKTMSHKNTVDIKIMICNLKHIITSLYTVARRRIYRSTLPFDAITAHLIGRMHPYRGYGCVPLGFGGASLEEWEHNNK